MEAVICGCVGAVSAIIVAIINNNRLSALMEYKIEELRREVSTFNNVKLRTFELEKEVELLKKDVEYLKEDKS